MKIGQEFYSEGKKSGINKWVMMTQFIVKEKKDKE